MINMLTVPTISGAVLAGAGVVLSLLAYLVPARLTKRERELRRILKELEDLRLHQAAGQGHLPFEEDTADREQQLMAR